MYIKEYIKSRPKLKEFEFAPVKREEIFLPVEQMNSTMSVGHDLVSTLVLKTFADIIVPELTHVVNLALISLKYPDQWKLGIISSVPKPGDLKVAKNWRPVTLLCTMLKTLEKIMNRQLKAYMERGILGHNQHTFRRSKSTQSAWVDLDTRIQKARDSGKYVGLILVDISAAFNLVSKKSHYSQVKYNEG